MFTLHVCDLTFISVGAGDGGGVTGICENKNTGLSKETLGQLEPCLW